MGNATSMAEFESARRVVGVLLSLCLLAPAAVAVGSVPAFASVPARDNAAQQPRTLGKKAVMHVYYFAQKTLEITYVDSYFFSNIDDCENSVDAALRVAMRRARAGDQVDAQCVAIDPPDAIAPSEPNRLPAGTTQL